MHGLNGTYKTDAFKVTFTAARHDDRWGITVKNARGQSQVRETLGASPWPVLGEMIDATLDLSRKNIAAPCGIITGART
jgi:hypothetical protein